jgi:hypothetical protein
MTDRDLLAIDFTPGSGARPVAGRIVLDIDPLPERIGSLFVPESSRTLNDPIRDVSHTARVVAVGYGPFGQDTESATGRKRFKRWPGLQPADVAPGDRVIFRLLMSDLNQRRVIADVRRVDAVIGDPCNGDRD